MTNDDQVVNEDGEEYTPIYPTISDIQAMIKFNDDDITMDLILTSCKNADGVINGMLSEHSLSTYPQEEIRIPVSLNIAGNYLAVSDIHQSIDGTDERATNEEAYYDKAIMLIQSYINEQLDKLANTTLKDKSPYASSKSKGYQRQVKL